MDSFSSLFELLAAFNAAFVVSKDFLDALNSRIIITYDSFKKKLKKINTTILKNSQLLEIGLGSDDNGFIANKVLEMGTLKDLYEEVKSDLNAKIKNQTYPRFNYYCLFGLIYSVFILFVIGFEAPIHPTKENALHGQWALLSFNIFISIFLFFTLKKKAKVFSWANFNYKWSVGIFILGLIFSFFFCWLGGPVNCTQNIYGGNYLYYATILSSIFLGGGQYVAFFSIAVYNRIKRDEDLVDKINDLQTKVENLQQSIESVSSYVNAGNGSADTPNTSIVEGK